MRGVKGEAADSFAEVFRELFVRCYALTLRILQHREDAEDAASEALARTLASWGRVSRMPYRDGWVLRVAANVAIDMARRRRRAEEPTRGEHAAADDIEGEMDVDRLYLSASRLGPEMSGTEAFGGWQEPNSGVDDDASGERPYMVKGE